MERVQDPVFEIKKEEVKNTLIAHNIPFDTWGKGAAKTVDDLVREVIAGETILEQYKKGGLLRRVNVVGVHVFHEANGKVFKLEEQRQEFEDGRERRRSLPTSMGEKVQSGEDADAAAQRAIHEELGIMGEIPLKQVSSSRTERISNSYPGLRGEYVDHHYEAWLTDEQYKPEGYQEEQQGITTYFVWKEVETSPTSG